MIRMFYKVYIDCVKNLTWPNHLPEAPQVGDFVRAACSPVTMRVVSRTWGVDSKGQFCEIELGMPAGMTIPQFENTVKSAGI